MNISGVRIFVNDFETAVNFYKNTLGLKTMAIGPGFMQFDTGAAKLMIEEVGNGEPADHQTLVGRFTGITFNTDDIQTQVEKLKQAGVKFTGEPEQQYWGGWLATFEDPSGNEFQLVEHPT